MAKTSTGLEENVFFSLFNDRFLGISPHKGHSIIEGDTRALSEIIGDNAPRLSVLNDIIRNLNREVESKGLEVV